MARYKVVVLRHISETFVVEADSEDGACGIVLERETAPVETVTLYSEITGSGRDD